MSADKANFDAIVSDISELKKDLAKLMDHVKINATSTVNDETRRIYNTVLAEGERSATALAHRIEDKPFASILIAFAIGFVGANLLKS
jgi:hypothetical protein